MCQQSKLTSWTFHYCTECSLEERYDASHWIGPGIFPPCKCKMISPMRGIRCLISLTSDRKVRIAPFWPLTTRLHKICFFQSVLFYFQMFYLSSHRNTGNVFSWGVSENNVDVFAAHRWRQSSPSQDERGRRHSVHQRHYHRQHEPLRGPEPHQSLHRQSKPHSAEVTHTRTHTQRYTHSHSLSLKYISINADL